MTFALDGAPEVVHDGVSGFLVPPVDTAQLAERAIELLGAPDVCQQFGDAGRRVAAEHFRIEHMVDRINAVYFAPLTRRELATVA